MSAAHQITAADPALSVFVTANAGSGKTTTLVNRVARLLLEKVRPGEILCVTYTKAAAAEMQARLFDTLGSWAVMDDGELAKALAELDDGDSAALSGERLSEARRLFARALETPGGLKIQTIHAFCEKLLRRFPLEAGVSPNFQVLENEAARSLSRTARDDLARAAGNAPDGPLGRAFAHFAGRLAWDDFQALLATLETERGKLVGYVERAESGEAPDPHALAEAELGSTPETIEAAFLDHIDPAAWRAAADGFAGGSKSDQSLAGTMRVCAPPQTTLDALYPVFIDSKGLPRAKFGTRSAPPFACDYLADVQTLYLDALERARAARVAEDTVLALTLARAHAALYEAEKVRAGALDFTDLVDLTRRLLTEKADAAWVLYKLDGGIEHVLIDEAQDTAPDQWAVFRALTEEFFAGSGVQRRLIQPRLPRTVFAVGDEKQSIYSFQGARPERLRQEAQQYETLVRGADRPFQEVPLDTSFRSTEQVLAFVDAAFHGPDRARALVGPTGEIATHTPARKDQPGSVELWPLFRDPEKIDRDAWAPVDQEPVQSGRKQLARALAEDIRRQVETRVAVWDKDPDTRVPVMRPAGYGDFLILVRRRDATFEEIIRALKSAGVPVAGADRLKLSSHIVFDDLKAMARFVQFPDDDLTLAALLRSPFCDVPDFGPADSLYELAETEQRAGRTLWRALRDRADEQPSWRRARELMQTMIAARGRDPFAFFSLLLNRVDETGRSGRARILHRLGREAEEAIDESLNQVLAAEARGGLDLETNLALLEAADVEVKRELEGPRGEVRVMTVHGAKGLEAPVVILPDTTMRSKPQGPTLMPVALGDPLIDPEAGEGWLMCPGRKGDDCVASRAARDARERRTDEESMRLLYVALTRARDRIVVMGRACSRPKEGFEERSWWAVLAETFDRIGARDLGDGRLRHGPDPVTTIAPPAEPVVAHTLPAWATATPPVDPAARYVSPSRMDPSIRIPAPSPLATTGPGASLGRFRRGDLIHRLLERLPEIAADQRADAAARMMSRERDLADGQREEMIAAALSILTDDRFAPVFGPGSRAEVALTGSAPDLPPGVTISGRIDRLVVTPDRVLVVDYKTNRPAPDRVEDADPAYVLQLATYVAVLRRLYPDRAVEAALVWTDGPWLMAVPGVLLDAALAALR